MKLITNSCYLDDVVDSIPGVETSIARRMINAIAATLYEALGSECFVALYCKRRDEELLQSVHTVTLPIMEHQDFEDIRSLLEDSDNQEVRDRLDRMVRWYDRAFPAPVV